MTKSFTPYPLSPYSGKKFGLVSTLVCIPLLIAAQWLSSDYYFSDRRATHLLLALINIGLVFIALSQEKQEDERVIAIRYASYRITFSIFVIILVAFDSVGIFGDSLIPDLGMITSALLVIYIIVFHAGLYSNAASFYSNNSGRDNFRAYRKQILLYLIPVTLLVLVGLGLVAIAL